MPSGASRQKGAYSGWSRSGVRNGMAEGELDSRRRQSVTNDAHDQPWNTSAHSAEICSISSGVCSPRHTVSVSIGIAPSTFNGLEYS